MCANFPTTLSFNTELLLPRCSFQEGFLCCRMGQFHRIENSLLGCDQLCFATGLCFSEHHAASCQDLFYNLNILMIILKSIERKKKYWFYSGKQHVLSFSAFLQRHKKLWSNLFSVLSLQEMTCIQGKSEALFSYSILFDVPHRFSPYLRGYRPK